MLALANGLAGNPRIELHHASEARSLELAGYLLKPVGRAELVAAVRRSVDGAT